MKYRAPYGSADPDAPYVDRDTPGAIRGSVPPAKAIEDPQRELVALLVASGLTPGDAQNQVTHAVRSQAMNYRAAAGTANAITLATALNPAPASHAATEGMPLRIKILAANTGPATLNAGPGPLPVRTLKGDPVSAGDLPAGAIITLIGTGGAWVLAGVAYSDFRSVARQALDYYVATNGNDNNDGSALSPWRTLNKAWLHVRDRIDTNGKVVRVNVADGTYTEGLHAEGSVLGGGVIFLGNQANPAACVIQPTNKSAFLATFDATFTTRGFTVSGAGANLNVNEGCGLIAQSGNITFSDMRFANSVSAHIYAQNGVVQAEGTSTMVGSAGFALYAGPYGSIQLSGTNLNVTGTPAFTVFALTFTGLIGAAGGSISGGATGKRFQAERSGTFVTNGAGPNKFPGNSAGTYDTTSSYN